MDRRNPNRSKHCVGQRWKSTPSRRDFHVPPKTTSLQRSIISVGEVAGRGNIIVCRSSGGTIFNEVTGNRIWFEGAGGVYRLKADTSAKRVTGTGGTEDNLRHLEPCLLHRVKQHWCRHCVRAKGKESPHPEASPGGASKFAVHARGWNTNHQLSWL